MADTPLQKRLLRETDRRRAEGLHRVLPPCAAPPAIDLSTNSYLALEREPHVAREARRLCDGKLSGNLASRLISSTSPLVEKLENELAQWKGTESALVFNSGYAANTGIISAVCSRDTEVFSDRLNHASILDGIRLSGARLSRYRHRDMDDLRARLQRSTTRERLIVTDTVFSMDGDRAPLPDICDLAERFACMVMVDEAHATGILGATGSGLAEECGVGERIDIRMGTLSKALAGLGGFFAGRVSLRDVLVNHARSLVYSTALPHAVLAHDLAAVRFLRSHPGIGKEVLSRAALLRERLHESGFNTLGCDTQIVPCVCGDAARAKDLAASLAALGIKAPAIRPPTVPRGTARVRFSVHRGITPDNIERVADAVAAQGCCP